jgi:hypothetical protein
VGFRVTAEAAVPPDPLVSFRLRFLRVSKVFNLSKSV